MKNKENEPMSEKFLKKLMNTSPILKQGDCRITIELGYGLLVEGSRGICDYSSERIVIRTYSGKVTIEGCGLCICRMMDDSVVICGKIHSLDLY